MTNEFCFIKYSLDSSFGRLLSKYQLLEISVIDPK